MLGPKYVRKHEESKVREAQHTLNMHRKYAIKSSPALRTTSLAAFMTNIDTNQSKTTCKNNKIEASNT